MHALVTGGAGFIGGHIVDALLAADWSVTVLDSLDPRVHPAGARPADGVRFVHGDVRDAAAVTAALEGGEAGPPEVVFHEAAMVGLGRGSLDAADYMDVNVGGTIALFEGLRRHGVAARVVLASSMAVYGEGGYECTSCDFSGQAQRDPTQVEAGVWEPACPACGGRLEAVAVPESTPFRPETIYAISKAAQEQVALSLGEAQDLDVVALRYHNVYGPRMPRDTPYAGVASLFRSRVLAGEPPLVHEDGGQMRDFVHVEDIARANLLAATADPAVVAGRAFNIGSGRPRPILDLARVLAASLPGAAEPRRSGTWRAGDARHIFASVAAAQRDLGYAPEITFEAGVERFLTDPARPPPAPLGA